MTKRKYNIDEINRVLEEISESWSNELDRQINIDTQRWKIGQASKGNQYAKGNVIPRESVEAAVLKRSLLVVKDETKLKMRDAALRRIQDPEYRKKMFGGKSGTKGLTFSAETRKKMSDAQKGIPRAKGRKASEVVNAKRSEAMKSFYQTEKGQAHRQSLIKVKPPEPVKVKTDPRIGRKLTEEHKEKIRQANKGRIKSEETREKLRQANLGKKATDETREKLRKAHTGTKRGPRSEETRKKISDSWKARTEPKRPVSEETREKLRVASIGRVSPTKGKKLGPRSEETKEKIRTALLGKKRASA